MQSLVRFHLTVSTGVHAASSVAILLCNPRYPSTVAPKRLPRATAIRALKPVLRP